MIAIVITVISIIIVIIIIIITIIVIVITIISIIIIIILGAVRVVRQGDGQGRDERLAQRDQCVELRLLLSLLALLVSLLH